MKSLCGIFLALFLVLATPATGFAAGSNGNGGGQGGGSSEPLVFVDTSIKYTNEGTVITLNFSKNVAYADVAEKNVKLVEVTDKTGSVVEVEVKTADDQVEPDKRNNLYVYLPQKEGEFTITAKQGITSKSGSVLEKDTVIEIALMKSSDATQASTIPPTTTAADIQSTETSPASNPPDTQSMETSEAAKPAGEQNSVNPVVIAILAAVALGTGYYFI